eukprot:361082-Chlamydomonas_euryale.AAC.13
MKRLWGFGAMPEAGDWGGVTCEWGGVTGEWGGVTGEWGGVTCEWGGVSGEWGGVTGEWGGVTGEWGGVTGEWGRCDWRRYSCQSARQQSGWPHDLPAPVAIHKSFERTPSLERSSSSH